MADTAYWIFIRDGEVDWQPFGDQNLADKRNFTVESAMSSLGSVTAYLGGSGTEIVFDSRSCPIECLASVVRTLPGPYFVRYFFNGWARRHCDSRDEVIDLVQSISYGQIAETLPAVSIRNTDISKVSNASFWRDVVSNLSSHVHRAMVFKQSDSGIVYEAVGPEAPLRAYLTSDWPNKTLGRPIELTLPDPKYDKSTSHAYRRVLESGVPELSHVVGVMTAPHGLVHVNYDRIVLPGLKPQTVASLSVERPHSGPPYPVPIS